MAFTKLYLTNVAAGYSPATLRGAWDKTTDAVTKALDPSKEGGGIITSVASAETSTTDEYDVLLYRGVSAPLPEMEVTVNFNVCIGIKSSSSSMNAHWHIHAYTTQGDSDTPRETVIDNYREAAGTNEWPTTAAGDVLNAAQSAHIHISAGDRFVVEIGYTARNTSATSYTGTLYYGTQGAGLEIAGDLSNTDQNVTTLAGFVSFSDAIAEQAYEARIAQLVVRTLDQEPAGEARVTQYVVRTLSIENVPCRVAQLVVRTLSPKQEAAATTFPALTVAI